MIYSYLKHDISAQHSSLLLWEHIIYRFWHNLALTSFDKAIIIAIKHIIRNYPDSKNTGKTVTSAIE